MFWLVNRHPWYITMLAGRRCKQMIPTLDLCQTWKRPKGLNKQKILKVSYQNKDSVPKVMVTNYLPNFGKSMINIISEEHKKADLVPPFGVSFWSTPFVFSRDYFWRRTAMTHNKDEVFIKSRFNITGDIYFLDFQCW